MSGQKEERRMSTDDMLNFEGQAEDSKLVLVVMWVVYFLVVATEIAHKIRQKIGQVRSTISA